MYYIFTLDFSFFFLYIAKERIMNTQKSISQISDEMGFQYPQHFTRWFKKMEGCTPNEYRNEIIKQAIN